MTFANEFYRAIEEGDIDTCIKYSQNNDIEHLKEVGLLLSITNDNLDIAEFLIEKVIDIDYRVRYNRNILHFYINYEYITKSVDTIKWMINKGIDINARDVFGFTPIYYVCENGALNLFQILFIHDVDTIENIDKLIDISTKKGYGEIVGILIMYKLLNKDILINILCFIN